MESIIDQVISYLTRAMDKWCGAKGHDFLNVQLCFAIGVDLSSVIVWYCHEWKPIEETTIKKALNKKIDILGIAGATEAFIGNALMQLSEKNKIPVNDARVMIQRKDQDDVDIHLYNKGEYVRALGVIEIFDPKMLQQ